MTKLLQQCFLFFIVVVIPGHNLSNSQVSVNRTIGPTLVSSPEPKAHGELIVYQSSRRPCVRPFTFSNMNISPTSRPFATKFYLKHHWGGERLHQVFGQIGLEL